MPGTVDRVVPSEVIDLLYRQICRVADRSTNGTLKSIAVNFIDDVRNDLSSAAMPDYEMEVDENGKPKLDEKNEVIFKLDGNGAKIHKMRPDGKPSLLVPMARQYKMSVDGLNAVWILTKEFLESGTATSEDISHAKIMCITLGMRGRWNSIVGAVVDASLELPLDGLLNIDVPLDDQAAEK